MRVYLRKKDRIYSQKSICRILSCTKGLTSSPESVLSAWVRVLRGQNPPSCNLKLSIKIFDLT